MSFKYKETMYTLRIYLLTKCLTMTSLLMHRLKINSFKERIKQFTTKTSLSKWNKRIFSELLLLFSLKEVHNSIDAVL